MVFLGSERYKHADSAAKGSVNQTVAASGDQVGLLKGENRFADVKDAEGLGLLSGTGEEPSVPKALGPGGVFVDLVVDVLAKPDHRDVAEFVSHRYRLVFTQVWSMTQFSFCIRTVFFEIRPRENTILVFYEVSEPTQLGTEKTLVKFTTEKHSIN